VRARLVSSLVDSAAEQMPWLRDEHLPLLRQWAELEVIRRAAFAGIVHHGLFSVNEETRNVSVKRLVHDHRQIAQTQLMFQRELMMTPLVASQLGNGGKEALDLVGLMADTQADSSEPVEPDAANATDAAATADGVAFASDGDDAGAGADSGDATADAPEEMEFRS
jgi:hypothetical protein